jgi:hypothetical protein
MRYRMTVKSVIDTGSPAPLQDIELLISLLLSYPDVTHASVRRMRGPRWRWPSWRLWSWRKAL